MKKICIDQKECGYFTFDDEEKCQWCQNILIEPSGPTLQEVDLDEFYEIFTSIIAEEELISDNFDEIINE